MPNIGYGSNAKTRHMLPTGFKKVLVHNIKVHSFQASNEAPYKNKILRKLKLYSTSFSKKKVMF